MDTLSKRGRIDAPVDRALPPPAPTSLRRRYVGQPGRQVHLLEAGVEHTGRPLYCLHATAYSGRSFSPLLLAMAKYRRVVAIDAPGYGASDPPAAQMGLDGYARAVEQALEDAGEGEVDLFGYHTGALIAAELAARHPERVARMVLIGVPYFSGAEQAAWRERLAEPMHLREDFSQFQHKWDYFITRRAPGVGLARGFENFVDELRAYPHGWWAHHAAFSFDVEASFARVRQPTLVINPDNHLSAASRHAAAALAQGQLLGMPHLSHGIFDVAAEELAQAMQGFLAPGAAAD